MLQKELVHVMFDFATGFSQLHLNDTEIGLFTGVVLSTAGGSTMRFRQS